MFVEKQYGRKLSNDTNICLLPRNFWAAIFICWQKTKHKSLSHLFGENRLVKMGCDGGTIPKRDELVRQKKKPEEVKYNMT